MRKLPVVLSLVVLSGVAGAQTVGVDQNALRSALGEQLKDADSAKFKNIRTKLSNGLWLVCGQVNAKNSFGAYAGFSPFIVMAVSGTPGRPLSTFVGPSIGDVAAIRCREEDLDH